MPASDPSGTAGGISERSESFLCEAGSGKGDDHMHWLRRTVFRKTAAGMLCLAMAAVCGCTDPAENDTGSSDDKAGESMDQYYENYDREPYAVRTFLKEYASADPDTGIGFYGRYTQLQAEGRVPDTLRDAIEASNTRAKDAVMAKAAQIMDDQGAGADLTYGYRYVTYGYIAAVTRADSKAFSILETEFEKQPGQSDSDTYYRFSGSVCDTQTGREILLAELVGDEAQCQKELKKKLAAKYGTEELVTGDLSDCAWYADALGIRFCFHSDAVSRDKRWELGDHTARAVHASFAYSELRGEKAAELSEVPDAYIAMIDRETVYDLPHGNQSVQLTEKDDSTVFRIMKDKGESEELIIEYADDLSDFYIIRAENGFYLARDRIGYQEGFFYDFARPDGGFGRFAYQTSQYFDSFLREILLAVPYNPYCVHLAEVRRSFGESSYGKASFVPNGHYTFPSDPKARYQWFVLTDGSLQIDSGNKVCRLLEDFSAEQIDSEGSVIGEITVPAGKTLYFESLEGEGSRYDNVPGRRNVESYMYTCRLTDGTRIRFESDTESTISVHGAYLNRFTEPVSLGEAEYETPPEPAPVFTVRINGKDYPLIPDYSLPNHAGEEIDFGGDIWWMAEGYPGRYVCTDEDIDDMRSVYSALETEERPELTITEDGHAVFAYEGTVFEGTLPQKRYYREYVSVYMESQTQRRTFRIILREGEVHSKPEKIEFYSEGLPATNEPSDTPELTVYLTRVSE